MQYSHNDHYKWGWGDGWFNDPQVDADFKVQIGSCTQAPGTFREECIRAAKLIAAQFTKPTLIGLSGGSDSQVVCLAFLQAGLPFQPLILRLKNSDGAIVNEHDTKIAFAFCAKHEIEPLVETVDTDEWYDGRGFELAQEHCLNNVETLMQLWAIERFKTAYSYVMGGGDMVVTKGIGFQDDSPLVTGMNPTPIQQHLIKHGIEGVTKFFMYTPELIAAYLDNDIMHAFYAAEPTIYDGFIRSAKRVEPKNWWWCFNLFIKPLFYIKEWPELIQQRKFTGFEQLQGKLAEMSERLAAAHAKYDLQKRKVVIRIDDLRDHLLAKGSPRVWLNNGVQLTSSQQRRA